MTYSRADFLKVATGRAPSQESLPDNGKQAAKPTSKSTVETVPQPSRLGISTYKGTWDKDQMMHLLRRSLFGVKHADVEYFKNKNLNQCLDRLLTLAPTPLPPVVNFNNGKDDSKLDPTTEFITQDPYAKLGETWVDKPYGALLWYIPYERRMSFLDSERRFGLKGWWAGLQIHQDQSLTEKMTLFWNGFLVTQMKGVFDARMSYKYVALIRQHALGNFKTLVRAIVTDPQMLKYLNGNNNVAGAPNENFARELQELFTIGKANGNAYTEDDVKAAARVLTGWTDNFISPESYVIESTFQPGKHDTGDKQFSSFYNNTVIKGRSGADGAKEIDDLIDMIFKKKETAKNLCTKLYRWFVYYLIDEQVEKNVIEPLAEILIANKYEVAPVMRALLGSEHFFDNTYKGCMIKNGVDYVIGVMRQFEVALPLASDIPKHYDALINVANTMENTGMNIGDPPIVAGWPPYYQEPTYHRLWIDATTLPIRNELTDRLCSAKGWNEMDITMNIDVLAFTKTLSNPSDPNKLIEDSTYILSPNKFDKEQTDNLKKNFLLSGQSTDYYWTEAWNEYIAKPDDEAAKSVILNRLRPYYQFVLARAEYQLM